MHAATGAGALAPTLGANDGRGALGRAARRVSARRAPAAVLASARPDRAKRVVAVASTRRAVPPRRDANDGHPRASVAAIARSPLAIAPLAPRASGRRRFLALGLRAKRGGDDVPPPDDSAASTSEPSSSSRAESNPSSAGAAAEDATSEDATAEVAASEEPSKRSEIVGVEGPPPADAQASSSAPPAGPPSSKLRDGEDKAPSPRNGGGGFFNWFRAVFQPLRLFALAVNTFLFFFAAQLFHQNNQYANGATHLVPVSYSRFLTALKGDDISSLTVDGVYLTWKPKQPFVIKRAGTGPMSMIEEKIEVAYSAARPDDASVPYETLHKNKVEFAAVDKRHQGQRNLNTFLSVCIIGLAMLQFNRIGAAGSRGRDGQGGEVGGRGGSRLNGGGFMRGMGGGPNTSAGRMTGGSERGALAPPSTTFNDVAGVDEAKEELQEIVDILKRPEHYTRLGARPPSGVLLVGAPGTGKTLLARAVAGEAGVPFISVSASEFVELYVGMGAARVRDVFARAREQSPSIVFIDEIDAVAKGRSEGRMRGMGNDEREQTLNQLLTELDGFDGESLVICLAATNRADTLDAALKRPGRFDRTVSVERPDKQGRREILGVHIGARALPLAPGFDAEDVAQMTAGFTGAELANLVNEAALLAGRKGLTEVGEKEFEDAVLRTVAGIEKKRSLLTAAEKVVVSAHEVGHAVVGTAVGALIPGCSRPEQLSIVARSGGALGFTYIPPGEEDRKLMFADELRGRLVTLMGGRAAEIVACGRVSTGALDDIQRATDLAYKAVAEYGLSPNLGPMSVPTLSSGGGDDGFFGGGNADDTNKQVEREVKDTLMSALWVAVGLVERNKKVLDDISRDLSDKEKVFGSELQRGLDLVEATDDLERFLRGDAPQPPAGSAVWDQLPLPEFPAGERRALADGLDGAGAR